MDWPTQTGIFEAGDTPLASGEVLRDARLSWKTHGTLSAARDNVVLYPCSYSAQHPDLEWLIGPDGILDPTRWFIVIPDMLANGLSSSPSNTPDYPDPGDDRRQRPAPAPVPRASTSASTGWPASTAGRWAALQAYHWAALFPDAVERAIVVCGVRPDRRAQPGVPAGAAWRRWRPRRSTSAAAGSRPSPRRPSGRSAGSTPAGR